METVAITANDLRFSCLAWGDAGAPLVLLAHGFPDTPHTWDHLGPALARAGYRVVAPFLRGYAPTEAPRVDTTVLTLAEDLAALVPALGATRAHLVGHDWGAEGAYGAVGIAPTRFDTLTTIAIPHRARLRPSPRIAWGLRHFVELTLPGAEARFARDDFAQLEALLRRWSPTWRYTDDDLAPIRACFRAPGTVHAALGYYRASRVRTPPCMAEPVRVPTLCVYGGDDPIVRRGDYAQTRAHFLQGMTLAEIPGGHFCHRESPEALLPPLLAHLRAPGGLQPARVW
ncbi:MAG: alpha/beta hydrolase [Polyangiales bacterium]